MAKHWEQLTLVEIEDIKATLKKQREADQVEALMCEELDKCGTLPHPNLKNSPKPLVEAHNRFKQTSGKQDEPATTPK